MATTKSRHSHSIRINFLVNEALWKWIEATRGKMSRCAFMRDALKSHQKEIERREGK